MLATIMANVLPILANDLTDLFDTLWEEGSC